VKKIDEQDFSEMKVHEYLDFLKENMMMMNTDGIMKLKDMDPFFHEMFIMMLQGLVQDLGKDLLSKVVFKIEDDGMF